MNTSVEKIMCMLNTTDREVAEKIHSHCEKYVWEFEHLLIHQAVMTELSRYSKSNKECFGRKRCISYFNDKIRQFKDFVGMK